MIWQLGVIRQIEVMPKMGDETKRSDEEIECDEAKCSEEAKGSDEAKINKRTRESALSKGVIRPISDEMKKVVRENGVRTERESIKHR